MLIEKANMSWKRNKENRTKIKIETLENMIKKSLKKHLSK